MSAEDYNRQYLHMIPRHPVTCTYRAATQQETRPTAITDQTELRGLAAQCSLHQIYDPLGSHQATTLSLVSLERRIHRVRGGMLAQFGPNSPIFITRSLDAAVDHMTRDGCEDDLLKAYEKQFGHEYSPDSETG